MSFRAAVFVRIGGAEGTGHLGWAFDIDAARADVGSVENPQGWPVTLPGDAGFWSSETPDPIAPMLDPQHRYDLLKYTELDAPDFVCAFKTVLWVKRQPYCVFGRNCMDDAYDVLRAYGIPNLPPPVDHWLPNDWFTAFEATQAAVAGFTWFPAPAGLLAPAPSLLDLHAAATPDGEAPAWRVQGSPEWYDLQVQKARASERPSHQAMAARVPAQAPWQSH